MDVVRTLAILGGSARREMLLEVGCTWDAIEAALTSGRVVRRHRGVYALPNAAVDVVSARVFRAQVGCLSACEHWGLRSLEPQGRARIPHLIVPRSRSQSRPGLRAPWPAVIHRSDTYVPGELWVPCATAIDQMADCASPLDQLIAIDGALYDGIITPADVAALRCGTSERRDWLLSRASHLAQSPLETITRVVLVEAGFPVMEQLRVNGVGRPDFVLEDGSVVEVDGFDPHGTRFAFREDRRRGRALELMGRGELRYTFEDVVGNPTAIVRDVERLLGRRRVAQFAQRWGEITDPAGMRTVNPTPYARATLAKWRP